jgi:hypothetical protein
MKQNGRINKDKESGIWNGIRESNQTRILYNHSGFGTPCLSEVWCIGDPLSLRLANILVGKHEGEAALEASLIGPRLRFITDGIIAVTGGDLSPSINGNPVADLRLVNRMLPFSK